MDVLCAILGYFGSLSLSEAHTRLTAATSEMDARAAISHALYIGRVELSVDRVLTLHPGATAHVDSGDLKEGAS